MQDIKNVTSRRNPNIDIYVFDAQVQGKYTVQDVIEGITYFDELGRNHFISYENCAMNGPTASCVAERDITKWYFKFYSSSVSIKFVFRSLFAFKRGTRFLTGGRARRFRTLQKLIADSGYTTYDLS